ncbi:FAD-dependent monooxygenase [Bradyrhizobium sp. 160]|uniref:FAD-dependent monooxygenase n=1 Tax=unclassified Bradyrhizobium TaxID=2631580 RepID=UPI001FFAA32F|nr:MULTISPECIES: FAD-dependent monooxygenase [unclassified Bradyrhizobium]MCK1542719.1 FAD-dependent monooxygenase [Bradyrhizobium sp. 179]MCK1621999.1 FAD-dependent monooxygenase [Bradyrhizobium sp. 160]
MSRRLEVAITGAGIGGLTAALALRARGLKVKVFEQAPAIREVGAGLTLGRNAVRLLRRIGLEDQLQRIGSANMGLTLLNSHGAPIGMSPLPARARLPGEFDSYSVLRAEFVSLLAEAQPPGTLHFGHRCVEVDETGAGVRLTFANGACVEADLFIGADGIHSFSQREIGVKTQPTSGGTMAYRGLVPVECLPWARDLRSLRMWIGPGRSFICYPVSRGRLINIVAFVPADRYGTESWSAPGDLGSLAAEYVGWDAHVLQMIAALDETFLWGIYDRDPLPYWSTARRSLLGDAAHPMLPHLGQGAGQAIEDGFALAVLLENAGTAQIPERLKAYERLRHAHTSQVQAASREAGRFFHSEDGDAPRRAQQLASWRAAGRWINEYDVETAATELLHEVA